MTWDELKAVGPRDLAAARIELHYGALVLGSAAHAALEIEDDDSHANLAFSPKDRTLRTRVLDQERDLALGLDLETLTLFSVRGTVLLGRFPLAGQTLESALRWSEAEIAECGGDQIAVARREFADFQQSPLMHGAPFEGDRPEECRAIAGWFALAHGLLESLRPEHTALSELRVWPHHFDLGGLLPLDGPEGSMIGLGLSLGDEHYDQPYFYCSPYPQPKQTADLGGLPVGHWHTSGFVSAVATGEELLDGGNPAGAAHDYLQAALRHRIVNAT